MCYNGRGVFMKKEKSCGAVVFNDKNEVLLITHNDGHICFPKGHVELNETEVETAKREVLEETGILIQIDNSKRVVITYNPKVDVVKDVVFFRAKAIGGTISPQIEEVKEVRWVSIDEAFLLITYDDSKEVLSKMIGSDGK